MPHVLKGFIQPRLISFTVTESRFEDFCIIRDKFVKRLLLRGQPERFLSKRREEVSYAGRFSYLHRTTVKRGADGVPFITKFTSFNAGFVNWHAIFRTVYSNRKTVTVIGFPAINTGRALIIFVNSLFFDKEKASCHATQPC
jgi:hypothetical protein